MRLKSYDYSLSGAYFVTICTKNRVCIFGAIISEQMRLNTFGQLAADCWLWLGAHFPQVSFDEWVIMPNHLHGIIILGDEKEGWSSPAPTERRIALSTVVGAFKTISAKRINEIRATPGAAVWQRSFYERIVRSDDELQRIRQYIADNPEKWATDRENPAAQRLEDRLP
jgi:REP-associated tyrosine transposase